MGDSETKFQSDVSHAALVAELSSLRDLLAEQNKQLNDLVEQLHDRNHRFTEQDEQLVKQDERLAELIKPVRVLQNEIRPLKKLPRRPDLKPSGLAASMQGNEEKPASGSSSGSERSKKDKKGRRKGHTARGGVTQTLAAPPRTVNRVLPIPQQRYRLDKRAPPHFVGQIPKVYADPFYVYCLNPYALSACRCC